MNLRTQALFHPSVVVWGDEILDQAKVVPKDHQCKDQEMDTNKGVESTAQMVQHNSSLTPSV